MTKTDITFKVTAIITLMFVIFSFKKKEMYFTNKQEAKLAYEYLNKFRNDPKSYGKEIGIKLKNKPKHELKWNKILASIAEQKAYDMATKNYFSHYDKNKCGINITIHNAGYKLPKDWIRNKRYNFFESICAGTENGIDAINELIIDDGEPSLGHRNHLLGIDKEDGEPKNSKLIDIGIGYVESNNPKNEFKTYISVIIATNKN